MPTYAYRCRDCGHELEAHQGFADAALTECPVCGGVLRKQYGTVGVTFNGSGFYRTDSRAAAEKAASGAKSDGGSSGKSDVGSSGSGESKPAAGAKDSGSSSPAKPAASTPAS